MNPTYTDMIAEIAKNPAAHVAIIWGAWMVRYMLYLGRRVSAIEKKLGIDPPPQDPPSQPIAGTVRG